MRGNLLTVKCLVVLVAALPCVGRAESVTLEAESGALGSAWAISNAVSPAYITITTDSTGTNPGSDTRVATYTVTFPTAGAYQLYARLRVGPNPANDDSFFYASKFGPGSPTLNSDWVQVNGLSSAGFSNSADVVTGGGTLGSGMWKWLNVSVFTGQPGFNVGPDALTRNFQIGGRENGLDIDKLVFGRVGYSFTVAELDAGGPGFPPATTVDVTKTFQVIEGFGAATAFYAGWLTAHPYKQEIYTNAFAGLNLSMLRLGNWFRYQGAANFDSAAAEIVSNATRVLGRPVPVYMSSWAPPAFLKSNGEVGNGGTLIFTNGGFAYDLFADYWHDSLLAYRSNGVSPTWISIQNEPDWEAGYDSCVFRPNEGVVNGTNYASYAKALDAVSLRLKYLASPPKLLAPEVVHIAYNDLRNYGTTLNANSFYGVAYHLYGDSSDGSADGFTNNLASSTSVFPAKPHFMTEYGVSNMIESATLIHNCLTHGLASGYNHWSLVWPGRDGGLIQIEFPWNQAQWTNAPPGTPTQSRGYWISPSYWALKHFSFFVTPGSRRVAAICTDPNVRVSSYLTGDGLRLVTVFINRSMNSAATVTLKFGPFPVVASSVYQTSGTNTFQALGAAGEQLVLPQESLTTVVLEKLVVVGAASQPTPANNATAVPFQTELSWLPGNNALTHAVFLGTDSNAVSQATPASPEFKGYRSSNSAALPLAGMTKYFWRVDEIAGANTNRGPVWSFVTAPWPALVHRYSLNETGGTNLFDSAGGPAWEGRLPKGGALGGGQLTLVYSSQQYAALPAGIVSSFSNFTIEAWVRLSSATNWSRIFDFGANTTTNMFLTPQNGGNLRLRFGITTNGSGGEKQITGPTPLPVGAWSHVAVTLNGTTGILYLNGVAVGTNTAMAVSPWQLGQTGNNYLGRSQYPDPYFNGQMDEFRIYSTALSASELAATYALGPDQLLSQASPELSMAAGASAVTLSWPLASAGFSLQWRTNLMLGNWQTVASPAPQITGGRWQSTLPVTTNNSMFYRLSK